MTLTEEQNKQIAKWISDGLTLSDIQKNLSSEFDINMTYIDVRFLVDDLNLVLKDKLPDKSKIEPSDTKTDSNTLENLGGVSVDVDKVIKPGVIVSGTARFSDNVTAEWYVDNMGQLGLNPSVENYQPNSADIQEFQKQLEAVLRKKGL